MGKCVWCGAENAPDGRYCNKCGKELDGGTIPGKCVKCGNLNSLGMTKCGNCGATLPEVRQDLRLPERQDISCKWCGNPAEPGSDTCWECNRRRYDDTPRTLAKRSSGGLTVAAVLLIIAGLLAILQGMVYLWVESIAIDLGVTGGVGLACCGMLDIVFGIAAVAGGAMALKRSNFVLVIIGCVLAMLSLAFVIGSLLGLIALILVAVSKDDF